MLLLALLIPSVGQHTSKRKRGQDSLRELRLNSATNVSMDNFKDMLQAVDSIGPSLRNLGKSLGEIVTCIVCHTISHSKILQCPNGHLTCDICRCTGNLLTCPMCRISLHHGTRALAVEQIIEVLNPNFKCRNGDCGFSGSKEELVQHHRTCEHKDNNNNINNTGFGMFIQVSSNLPVL